MISEALLHFVWKNKIYSSFNFKTTHGKELQIIHPGYSHQDAGPDFKQAILKIDGIIWAGDVEIHISSSEWYKHNHHFDDKYNSVILHVVYNFDKEVFINNNEMIPSFEIQNYISNELLLKYDTLFQSYQTIPCALFVKNFTTLVSDQNQIFFSQLYQRVLIDRLEEKQKTIFKILDHSSNDWNETIFKMLTKNFGFKTNDNAFELLSKSISFKILKYHSHNHLQIYALIFGQSGLLDDQREDEYYNTLQNEYQYLRKLYKLIPIQKKNWNLLRLRPHNFPCIRLAQLSEILHHSPDLFSRIENHTEMNQYEKIFVNDTDMYWKTHFHFGKTTQSHTTSIGKPTFYLLMINTIIPLLYAYGTFTGNYEFKDKALDLLSKIEPENNKIIRLYKNLGFPVTSSFDSQAILEMAKSYCNKKLCLECGIGKKILSE
ncbi:MAG: DUF2851 domain-containing protein [Bacteroidetes bacterium HGW-Bacteroidetes-20]|nr:MAG: DUF2851 domain-containing protein [Bacteroidetes bacterium HGW-Bacteroidetes-20]